MLQYLIIALVLAGAMFYLGRRFYGVMTGRVALCACKEGQACSSTPVKGCGGSCAGRGRDIERAVSRCQCDH